MYSYDPGKINEAGKDLMRFELGDTLVEGGADTCALSDEEYFAVIGESKATGTAWLRLKLRLLEAICMKLSYQVDYKVDTISYSLSDRAKFWQSMYKELKKQLSVGVPNIGNESAGSYYFYKGIHSNNR